MDITTQIEITLRDANYDTWPVTISEDSVTCFEDQTVIGFVHIFTSLSDLLDNWQLRQEKCLSRHAAALRNANTKAWNVYSVFLTEEPHGDKRVALERIEEDFSLTRKIARAGIRTDDDVKQALLSLLSIQSKPVLGKADFDERLRKGLVVLPTSALTAFMSDSPADEVARILGAQS